MMRMVLEFNTRVLIAVSIYRKSVMPQKQNIMKREKTI